MVIRKRLSLNQLLKPFRERHIRRRIETRSVYTNCLIGQARLDSYCLLVGCQQLHLTQGMCYTIHDNTRAETSCIVDNPGLCTMMGGRPRSSSGRFSTYPVPRATPRRQLSTVICVQRPSSHLSSTSPEHVQSQSRQARPFSS